MDSPTSAENSSPPTGERSAHGGLLRGLYNWMLSWAETPYGTPALFVISFAESSFFPLPPDLLQIALSVSKPKRSFFYAAVSAVASVLGGLAGWLIGHLAWGAVHQFFYDYVPGVTPEMIEYVGTKYQENAFLVILGAAFTPIPYKVITIAAGVFSQYVPLQTLLIASAIGRSGRFFLVATLLWWFGPPVRKILEKHFELLTVLMFVLLVGGFVLIKWLAH